MYSLPLLTAPLEQHANYLANQFYPLDPNHIASEKIERSPNHEVLNLSRPALIGHILLNMYRHYDHDEALQLNNLDLKLVQIALLVYEAAQMDDEYANLPEKTATYLYAYLRMLRVTKQKSTPIAEALANKDMVYAPCYKLSFNGTNPIWQKIHTNRPKNIYQKIFHDAAILAAMHKAHAFKLDELDIYQDLAHNPSAHKELKQLQLEKKSHKGIHQQDLTVCKKYYSHLLPPTSAVTLPKFSLNSTTSAKKEIYAAWQKGELYFRSEDNQFYSLTEHSSANINTLTFISTSNNLAEINQTYQALCLLIDHQNTDQYKYILLQAVYLKKYYQEKNNVNLIMFDYDPKRQFLINITPEKYAHNEVIRYWKSICRSYAIKLIQEEMTWLQHAWENESPKSEPPSYANLDLTRFKIMSLSRSKSIYLHSHVEEFINSYSHQEDDINAAIQLALIKLKKHFIRELDDSKPPIKSIDQLIQLFDPITPMKDKKLTQQAEHFGLFKPRSFWQNCKDVAAYTHQLFF